MGLGVDEEGEVISGYREGVLCLGKVFEVGM